jgi:hypothetical protein
MKDSQPVLVAAAWEKGRDDELDKFDPDKANTAAAALHKMSKVYRGMADALKDQSQTLEKVADLAHTLIQEAKEARDG